MDTPGGMIFPEFAALQSRATKASVDSSKALGIDRGTDNIDVRNC